MNSYRIFLRNSLHYAGSILAISEAAAIAAFCWPDKDDEEFFVAHLHDTDFACYTLSSQTKEVSEMTVDQIQSTQAKYISMVHRFKELDEKPFGLTRDERVEYDTIGGYLSTMRDALVNMSK